MDSQSYLAYYRSLASLYNVDRYFTTKYNAKEDENI